MNQANYQNCLLGGAIGDALGAPIEFMRRNEIVTKYGPQGIVDYLPAYGRLGAITDDTQMTLFTAEGLLRSYVRWSHRGIISVSDVTEYAYKRWLYTQEHSSPPPDSVPSHFDLDGWLITIPELYHRRAPGNTCLSALKADLRSLPEGTPRNNSKGCGAVMRMAPVGLMKDVSRVFETGVELAALTHGHPSGQLPAGVFASVIRYLIDGDKLLEAIEKSIAELKGCPRHQETLDVLDLALDLAENKDISPVEAISRLGEGWVAEEALAISIYCSLVAKDFREGVLMAVNHDGDSDSTGSITGNILGLVYSLDSIPQGWLDNLELRDVISEIACDLYNAPSWNIGGYPGCIDDDWVWKKYPGC
ncbi:ADP-ribosylglycohydrolase family protein [Deltaproteobacteria bacterium OttesenSCG-928-M10]|nr:ADP-ribosylglycohydrolase family protein [Deltaproteobacteria bacterium OttesenSCG-928-M10]